MMENHQQLTLRAGAAFVYRFSPEVRIKMQTDECLFYKEPKFGHKLIVNKVGVQFSNNVCSRIFHACEYAFTVFDVNSMQFTSTILVFCQCNCVRSVVDAGFTILAHGNGLPGTFPKIFEKLCWSYRVSNSFSNPNFLSSP